MHNIATIQGITPQWDAGQLLIAVEQALSAGLPWLQYRDKDSSQSQVLKNATIMRKLCLKYGSTFIVNDYVEIVQKVDAHGVHLGKADMDIGEARNILGKNKIIGGTANTFHDVEVLYSQGVDYIGLGPYQFTSTKENLSPLLKEDDIKEIATEFANKVPIILVGGITQEDFAQIVSMNVHGIAVSSYLFNGNINNNLNIMNRFGEKIHV